jgi:hypothetical protein
MSRDHRHIEKVAEDFSEAIVASYKECTSENDLSMQPNAEQTEEFGNAVIAYLAARSAKMFTSSDERQKMFTSSDERQMSRTRKEEDEDITAEDRQPSVAAYMDFLGELLAHYHSDAAMTA